MKRDMDLVRRVLLATEDFGQPVGVLDIDLEDFTPEEVSYHVKLLHDAGFIEALDFTTMTAFCWKPKRLTWRGHEFLDTVKNDTVWRKTKEFVKEKGGSIPFDILKVVAAKFAAAHFGVS